MTKKKKRRKKKNYSNLPKILFCLTVILYICASLIIGTINTALTYEIQENQNRIEELKEENRQLTIDISELEEKNHVISVAEEAGLTRDIDNIIYAGN